MFYTNINLKPSTFKTILGIIFIILAGYIGHFAIRLAMVIAAIAFAVNLKMTFHYSGKLKKSKDLSCLIGSILIFIFPQLVVFVLGIGILYLSAVALYEIIKSKSYDDKLKLISSILGLAFSIFCIFNAQGTLELVIRLLGALLIAIGCIAFYQYITKTRNPQPQDDFIFEDNETPKTIIEVQEIIDIKDKE